MPHDDLWTIAELGAQVARALARGYDPPASARVRDVPDLRTIRYYTTLGLLDRPAAMRGRTALYARRHLLQLVGIKRLQALGLTLAEVQQRLLGVGDRALSALAALPERPAGEPGPTPASAPRQPSDRRFWTDRPLAVATHADPHPDPGPAADPAAGPAPGAPLVGIDLGAGAFLVIAADRSLAPGDVAAVRDASSSLLQVLDARGLVARRSGKG